MPCPRAGPGQVGESHGLGTSPAAACNPPGRTDIECGVKPTHDRNDPRKDRPAKGTTMDLSRTQAVLAWALQIGVALILLQTLFFKFTAAEESVYIFSRLGIEPWGRIGSGVAELIAVLLLLHPRTAALGALL